MTRIGAPWQPRFSITPVIERGLRAIEVARGSLAGASLAPKALADLRQKAVTRSTHYSTRIEGNRLTLSEAARVIAAEKVEISGRQRDVLEVRHYWKALQRVERWAVAKAPISALGIRRLHALVEFGASSRPTAFRDGQNVIREAGSGAMVYLPPEAKEVPAMMAALVGWLSHATREELPVPLVAHLAHYQFVTIHPFWDGNGRTARLLERWVLSGGGYGLAGLVGLEEGYASDPGRYYQALTTHPHHNYYEGRETADLTPWLEYAVQGAAEAFTAAAAVAGLRQSVGKER